MLHGRCLCQRVAFCVDGPAAEIVHCHCLQCRKSHGAAFASYVNLRSGQLQWLQGETEIAYYRSSAPVKRGFCRHCGSPLSWQNTAKTQWISLVASCFDSPLADIPQRHVHIDNRPDWACSMPSLSHH